MNPRPYHIVQDNYLEEQKPPTGLDSVLDAIIQQSTTTQSPANYANQPAANDTYYNAAVVQYQDHRALEQVDFTSRVPGKHVDILPANVMGGVLGFTYLGQDRMTLRGDLIGDREMVDVHESIHTPDEYETRVLTEWILARERDKYIR